MYKIYNAFICSKEFCCSKKPQLIMKLTMVMLTVAFLQASAKTSGGSATAAPAVQKTIVAANPAAAKTVIGKVTDDSGQPLPGVVVKVKDHPQEVTTTDVQGNYKITFAETSPALVFTFTGFESQEISTTGKTRIDVTMVSSNTGLNEVVVVAYGTQKKTSVTGAVGTVTAKELQSDVVDNTLNSVTGRTPGVRVTQLSSQPGNYSTATGAQIDIRGFSSINSTPGLGLQTGIDDNQTGAPLFIIDGVPRNQDDFARLDPNEIESFSVLKDATAAIYGVKAANGVILVTTKKGTQGAVQVSYSGQWGSEILLKYPQMANTYDYMRIYDEHTGLNGQETGRGTPVVPYWSAAQIAQAQSGVIPTYNWIDIMLKHRSGEQTHNVTINGGSDKVRFFTSAGYFQQGGMLNSDIENNQKYNFRQDVNFEILKGLKMDINLGLINDVVQGPNSQDVDGKTITNIFRNTYQIPPMEPPLLNGVPGQYFQFNQFTAVDNTLALIQPDVAGVDNSNRRSFTSTFTLSYDIPQIKGLSAQLHVSYDLDYQIHTDFAKAFNEYSTPATPGGAPVATLHENPSTLLEDFYDQYRDDTQFQLNYNNHFGKHNITVLGLFEETYNKGENFATGTQFAVDVIPQISSGIALSKPSSGNLQNLSAEESFVGRVNYDYAGKYLFEAGFRDDGSSFLAPATRWGFFPYASAGWRISEEPFIKDNFKWIDNIKIRASYGTLGDDQAASTYYPYFETGYVYPSVAGSPYGLTATRTGGSEVGTVFGPSGGITKGYDFKAVANPAITWFTSTTSDIGLETSFWNGKLTFEGDIFRRDRTGLLTQPTSTVVSTYGAVQPYFNLNGDRTQGFELALGHHNRLGEFTYNIGTNMGFSRTEQLYIAQTPKASPMDNWLNNNAYRYTDELWGQVTNGQFQNYQQIYSSPVMQDGSGNRTLLPGAFNFVDENHDGVIGNTRNTDQQAIANAGAKPLVYFGLTLDGSWRGFDISMLLQGATLYNATWQDQLATPFPFSTNGDPLATFADRWHQAVDIGTGSPLGTNGSYNQSPWIPGTRPATDQSLGPNNYNATYIRLKQLQIGYTFPKRLLSKVGIQKVRIFATGYDLLTWQPHGANFVDPEYSDTYLYSTNYPISGNVNAGVQLTF